MTSIRELCTSTVRLTLGKNLIFRRRGTVTTRGGGSQPLRGLLNFAKGKAEEPKQLTCKRFVYLVTLLIEFREGCYDFRESGKCTVDARGVEVVKPAER